MDERLLKMWNEEKWIAPKKGCDHEWGVLLNKQYDEFEIDECWNCLGHVLLERVDPNEGYRCSSFNENGFDTKLFKIGQETDKEFINKWLKSINEGIDKGWRLEREKHKMLIENRIPEDLFYIED